MSDYDSVPLKKVGTMKVGPMEPLTPEQREQPTTKIELPPGQTTKMTGPVTAEMSPGAKMEPGDAATGMLPYWFKVGSQLTAIAIILGLFSWGYVRNEQRFDDAERERRATSAERSKELADFRAWTEARMEKQWEREDKKQDREDAMRSKLWSYFNEMKMDLKVLLLQHDGAFKKAMMMKKEIK